jgi:UPF0755 protein
MQVFKAFLGILVYVFMASLIAGGLITGWGYKQFKAEGPLLVPAEFIAPSGSSLKGIAFKLTEEGIIANPYILIAGALSKNVQGDLKAGEYAFEPGVSTSRVLAKITQGQTIARRITIREGLTSFEIVRLLNDHTGLSGEVAELPKEGSLLPNTYDYQKGQARQLLLARMQKEMQETFNLAWEKRIPDLPFGTKLEALTLASIIEKETGKPSERRRVAGVFVNRLRRGMPLQTDPTVIYAITKGQHKNDGKGPLGRRLLRKDLSYDSPYNTYQNAGLPPGPIANPGKASIEAALNPETHDYLYFVADGTGGHAFAQTLAEHNRNVAKWRKVRAKR